MNKIKSTIEKDFFSELDKKRSSLTTPWIIVIITLVIIFGVAVFGLIQARKIFSKLNFENWNLESLPKKSLSQKILELSKSNQSSFVISISSSELSAYLNLSDENFPLNGAYAKIKSDKVIVYGRSRNSRFGLPVSISLKPKVIDGNLIFENQPTDLEKIYMSDETRAHIASEITKRLTFDLNLEGKFKVDSFEQGVDKLIVKMVLK